MKYTAYRLGQSELSENPMRSRTCKQTPSMSKGYLSVRIVFCETDEAYSTAFLHPDLKQVVAKRGSDV
jgi:hypothetical protein